MVLKSYVCQRIRASIYREFISLSRCGASHAVLENIFALASAPASQPANSIISNSRVRKYNLVQHKMIFMSYVAVARRPTHDTYPTDRMEIARIQSLISRMWFTHARVPTLHAVPSSANNRRAADAAVAAVVVVVVVATARCCRPRRARGAEFPRMRSGRPLAYKLGRFTYIIIILGARRMHVRSAMFAMF